MQDNIQLINNDITAIKNIINLISERVGGENIWGVLNIQEEKERLFIFFEDFKIFLDENYTFIESHDLEKIKQLFNEFFITIFKYYNKFKSSSEKDYLVFNEVEKITEIESKLALLKSSYNKFRSYSFKGYLEKAEYLLKVEKLLRDLESKILDFDFMNLVDIDRISGDVRELILLFNDVDESHMLLAFSLDVFKEIESDLLNFLSMKQDNVDSREVFTFIDKLNRLIKDIPNSNLFKEKIDTEDFRLTCELLKRIKSLKRVELELSITNGKLDNLKSIQSDLIDSFKSSNSDLQKTYESIKEDRAKSTQYLKEMQKEKSIIIKYSEDIKNTDSVAVYTRLYNNEIQIAAWFRFFALMIFGIFSFLAIFCLIALFLFDENQIIVKNLTDMPRLYAKLPFILTFFVFGFYLAREGEKHRRIANQAKQTEGELIALASYTNGWDPQEIKELKIKLADKYFGKNVNESDKSSPADLDLINALVQQTKATTDLAKLVQSSDKVSKAGTIEAS